MKKYYYYVGIETDVGMTLVTSVDNTTHTAKWNTDEQPLELCKSVAMSIADGLVANYIPAVVLVSRYQRVTHPVAKGVV